MNSFATQRFCFTSGWNARALTHRKTIYSSITEAKHLTEGDKLGSLLYSTYVLQLKKT